MLDERTMKHYTIIFLLIIFSFIVFGCSGRINNDISGKWQVIATCNCGKFENHNSDCMYNKSSNINLCNITCFFDSGKVVTNSTKDGETKSIIMNYEYLNGTLKVYDDKNVSTGIITINNRNMSLNYGKEIVFFKRL